MKKKKQIKKVYKFCEYCGEYLIESKRENLFDKYTGKQLLWLICRKRAANPLWSQGTQQEHSKWVKELAFEYEEEA